MLLFMFNTSTKGQCIELQQLMYLSWALCVVYLFISSLLLSQQWKRRGGTCYFVCLFTHVYTHSGHTHRCVCTHMPGSIWAFFSLSLSQWGSFVYVKKFITRDFSVWDLFGYVRWFNHGGIVMVSCKEGY